MVISLEGSSGSGGGGGRGDEGDARVVAVAAPSSESAASSFLRLFVLRRRPFATLRRETALRGRPLRGPQEVPSGDVRLLDLGRQKEAGERERQRRERGETPAKKVPPGEDGGGGDDALPEGPRGVSRDLAHVCCCCCCCCCGGKREEKRERKGRESGEKEGADQSREERGTNEGRRKKKNKREKKRTLDDKCLVGLDVSVAQPEGALPRVRREDGRARDELEAVIFYFF